MHRPTGEKAAAPCGSCASVKDEDEWPSEDIKSTVSLTIFRLKWSFLMKSRSCNRRRGANEARRYARARARGRRILLFPSSGSFTIRRTLLSSGQFHRRQQASCRTKRLFESAPYIYIYYTSLLPLKFFRAL